MALPARLTVGADGRDNGARLWPRTHALPERFDVLRSRRPLPGLVNIALDHAVAASVGSGARPASVRIWNWEETLVVIGSSQSLSNEVDTEAARRRGVLVARRTSGGGTMFMDPIRAITYSVILPTQVLDGLSLRESYAMCDSWVLDALRGLGVPAFYRPINDIATDEGKVGGAAQRRLASGVTVHHATMSWEIDTSMLMEVTRLFRPDTGARGTKSAQKKVVGVRDYADVTRDEVIDAMIAEISRGRRVRTGTYRPGELLEAEKLVRERLATGRWLAKIP
ncbi:MAG: biotin/lipoate A/B protein ligase family protein [Actinomycetaceae bacterium]|nr:biotin/lipoate A/B protein ligase family protein [Actinomycetaceae bacterium]